MTFQNFLETYQILIQKQLDGTLYQDEVDLFLDMLEIAINAYAENANDAKYQLRKWDEKTKQLCSLREASKLLPKEKS